MHGLKYEDGEESMVVLSKGRDKMESPVMKVLPAPPTSEESTALLFSRLRSTMASLKYGKQRAFDPRPFVESCSCLNMNYSVFEQNDASEFADKLFDRIEMGLKGGPKEKLMEECFGGKIVYQKIPKGCSHRDERSEVLHR